MNQAAWEADGHKGWQTRSSQTTRVRRSKIASRFLTRTEVFFGTSHFGPQLAAKIIRVSHSPLFESGPVSYPQGAPSVPLSDVRHIPLRGVDQIDDTRPYTLVSQIRQLLPLIPKKEKCDRYVRHFMDRYNNHIDVLHEPDFMAAYNRFWASAADLRHMSSIDLRVLALILIVLAFGVLLEHNFTRKYEGLRALGELRLTVPERLRLEEVLQEFEQRSLTIAEREEMSLTLSWGARKALSEASSFYGESVDTVSAGALVGPVQAKELKRSRFQC